jgi:hypothetical protein
VHRSIAILFVLTAASSSACKIHRLPALPAERDPADEHAPIVPYRPPPDVLTTELSTGAPAEQPTHHHDHATVPPPEPAEPRQHAGDPP